MCQRGHVVDDPRAGSQRRFHRACMVCIDRDHCPVRSERADDGQDAGLLFLGRHRDRPWPRASLATDVEDVGAGLQHGSCRLQRRVQAVEAVRHR